MENRLIVDKMQYDVFVKQVLPHLKQLTEADQQIPFNELLDRLLPPVKRYIARRLRTAKKKKTIPVGKYKVDDFVDELYILAYEHIQKVKEDIHLSSWLFQQADELLEDAITEEEFDHIFMENIDNYSQQEWDEMEENFSTDGDGDLVMEEELDDFSYPKHDYTLADVFVEDYETDIIEKLSNELSEKEIHQHINTVLHLLPTPMRTTFNLAVNQQFELAEIADIKKIMVEEVEQYLTDARKYIFLSFENRFLDS